MNHERCSELLRAYVAESLGDADQRAVEEHLAACPDCAAEARAARALNEHAADEPLNDIERARLHRVVLQEVSLDAPARPAAQASGARWGWIGAAALVVALGMYVATQGPGISGLGGADSSGEAASGAAGDAFGSAAAPEAVVSELRISDLAKGRTTSVQLGASADSASDGAEAAAEDASGGSAGGGGAADAAEPLLIVAPQAGRFDSDDLAAFGRRAPAFVSARRTLTTEVVTQAPGYLDALAQAAPSDELATAIATCGEQMLAQGLPQVPLLAAFGQTDGRDVIVMGAVFRASGAGRLDRFSLWVWPAESCDIPITAVSGRIAR